MTSLHLPSLLLGIGIGVFATVMALVALMERAAARLRGKQHRDE